MTTTLSTMPAPTACAGKAQQQVEDRIRVAWHNGGPAAAQPRGEGRFVVTGRAGSSRYTVVLIGRGAATCDCPAGLHGRTCWHAAAAWLRALADSMTSAAPASSDGVTTTEAALVRSLAFPSRSVLDFDRAMAGLSALLDCDGCANGVVEVRVESAETAESPAILYAVNGSSWDSESREGLCRACTASAVLAVLAVAA